MEYFIFGLVLYFAFRPILCFFGIHFWSYATDPGKTTKKYRRCRCNKTEVLRNGKWVKDDYKL